MKKAMRNPKRKGRGCGRGLLVLIAVCVVLSFFGIGTDAHKIVPKSSQTEAPIQQTTSAPTKPGSAVKDVSDRGGRQNDKSETECDGKAVAADAPIVTAGIDSSGDDVRKIQTRLASMGYYTGTVDGVYSYATLQAVVAFQKNNDLSSNGIVDETTSRCLFSSNALPAPTAFVTATPTAKPANRAKAAVSSNGNEDQRASVSKGTTYVLNTSTKKFHLPSCASAKKIKQKNYKEYTGTREEVISMGYEPCKKCYP